MAKARGADHVLASGEPFREQVKELTDGRGADVVFDPVGGKVFEESLRCINWGARLVIVGFLQGVGVAQTNLVLIKNASILGIRAGEAVRRDPSLGPPRQRDLMRLAEEGKISPNVSHRLPLERWAEAMRLLIDRKAIGRVALVMDDDLQSGRSLASEAHAGRDPAMLRLGRAALSAMPRSSPAIGAMLRCALLAMTSLTRTSCPSTTENTAACP